MKKLFTTLVSALALAIIPLATASAAPSYTDVTGTIYYNGAHVGKGVKVTVKCNGNKLTTKTDKHGVYLVQFTKQQCPVRKNITVTATYDGITNTVTGKACKQTNKLNVALINVSLPEMGLVTGIGATVAAGAGFYGIRRRNLRAQA